MSTIALLLARGKYIDRKRHGEDLVRTQGRVVRGVRHINHVETAIAFDIPELLKTSGSFCGQLFIAFRRPDKQLRKCGHDLQRIDPECVDFDRFAVRGVTTQSPIFESIHVSWTWGEPAKSKPSTGSTLML